MTPERLSTFLPGHWVYLTARITIVRKPVNVRAAQSDHLQKTPSANRSDGRERRQLSSGGPVAKDHSRTGRRIMTWIRTR